MNTFVTWRKQRGENNWSWNCWWRCDLWYILSPFLNGCIVSVEKTTNKATPVFPEKPTDLWCVYLTFSKTSWQRLYSCIALLFLAVGGFFWYNDDFLPFLFIYLLYILNTLNMCACNSLSLVSYHSPGILLSQKTKHPKGLPIGGWKPYGILKNQYPL